MSKKRTAEITGESLLDQVNSPEDLKKIPSQDMPRLAGEIRAFLVRHVTETGGHLASNLGVVELTLAIHTVFNFPEDHLIFDVGHQSYVHKILTGRKDRFDTLRQNGGLSGFTRRAESPYDCFGAGHSSTSLSAALGFAEADYLQGKKSFTVAVVGDGAFTGGMIHEALNNLKPGRRLVIILNENEMSISKNIGRFAAHMARIRTRSSYYKAKNFTGKVLRHIPLIGKPIFRGMLAMKKSFKNALYGSNYFEDMGLYYLGPVDGHNYTTLVAALQEARNYSGITVVHVKTRKGAGYPEAENDPNRYHSVRPAAAPKRKGPTFSCILGRELTSLAREDDRICAITAAMCEGTGLNPFREAFPSRYFDVGIAEEHAVTFAAGLSASGFKPVFAVYSTFLQRSYDQLIHDCSLQNLPLTLCIDRAGLNPGDGPTHHGIFDVSMLLQLPRTRIYAPVTGETLAEALRLAISENGPEWHSICAIRYPNAEPDDIIRRHFFPDGKVSLGWHKDWADGEKPDAVVVTYGTIVRQAIEAGRILQERGKNLGVLLMERLPEDAADADELKDAIPDTDTKIILLEEGVYNGGLGERLRPAFREYHTSVLAVKDPFVTAEKDRDIWTCAGISADDIVQECEEN